MDLGCVCKLKSTSAGAKTLQRGGKLDRVSLDELDFQTTTQSRYLNKPLVQAYIYYSFSDTRGLIAFFPTLNSSKPHLIVVSPYTAERPNFNRAMQQQHQEIKKSLGLMDQDAEEFASTVSYARTRDGGFRELGRRLLQCEQQNNKPAILVFESTADPRLVIELCPKLDEYPIMHIASHARNNQYEPLGWQLPAVQQMMHSFMEAERIYDAQLELARFAHVPIGNLEGDDTIFVSDVFYGRLLRDNKHLLWAKDKTHASASFSFAEDTCFADEDQHTEAIQPEAYRSYCIEVEMSAFAINAVSNYNHLEDTEAAALPPSANEMALQSCLELGGIAPRTTNIVDDTVACAPAFKVLKQLVTNWLTILSRNSSYHADLLQMHFYRWLSSPHSRFHLPLLFHYFRGVMKKLFEHLLDTLRGLGTTVVYGSFSRVILCTGKPSARTAEVYVRYLIDTIQQMPMFQLLDLQPKSAWCQMLFMDPYNFGGFLGKLEGDSAAAEPSTELTDEEMETAATDPDNEAKADIECRWNIGEYLPTQVQKHFIVMISDFIDKCMQHRLEQDSGSSQGPATQMQTTLAEEDYVKSLFVGTYAVACDDC